MGQRYKIVNDPQMMSEKGRRKAVLAPMDKDLNEERDSASPPVPCEHHGMTRPFGHETPKQR